MNNPSKHLELSAFQALLAPRQRTAQKGDFGHVLIIGGDYGMAGAVRLAGEACAHTGAGLTTIATHPEHVCVVSAERPELMCQPIKKPREVEVLFKRATVIVLGPGLGQTAWSVDLFKRALAAKQPKVVDADALNLLAKHPQRQDWILTPHPGEAARLLNCEIAKVQQDRVAAAQALQKKYGGTIVLKGAGTLVLGNDGIPGICNAGNPGMATGGMGDVLSGIIGGLLAQGLNTQAASELGICLHARAGDLAAAEGERGMLALDLMPYIRQLVNPK